MSCTCINQIYHRHVDDPVVSWYCERFVSVDSTERKNAFCGDRGRLCTTAHYSAIRAVVSNDPNRTAASTWWAPARIDHIYHSDGRIDGIVDILAQPVAVGVWHVFVRRVDQTRREQKYHSALPFLQADSSRSLDRADAVLLSSVRHGPGAVVCQVSTKLKNRMLTDYQNVPVVAAIQVEHYYFHPNYPRRCHHFVHDCS